MGKNYTFQCFGAPTSAQTSATPIIPIAAQPQRSLALPAYSAPRNVQPTNQAAAFSPSANDDPWQRFMWKKWKYFDGEACYEKKITTKKI